MPSQISIDTNPSSSSSSKCVANVLPCQVDHNGPVNSTKRHWLPENNDDGTRTAYFRGRKLVGTAMKLPVGYTGHILEPSSSEAPTTNDNSAQNESDDEEQEKITMENWRSVGTFDELVVYGHETLPDDGKDKFIRSVQEWVDFSKAINGYDDESGFEESTAAVS